MNGNAILVLDVKNEQWVETKPSNIGGYPFYHHLMVLH
jgi:hypothetical protein